MSTPNVRAALEELERNHPSLYRSLCDETGTVRRHLNVFVNASHVRDRGGLGPSVRFRLFPIVVHPHDADTVYVMPLEASTRTCPGGAPAVWRRENGGESWKRLARGLPK